MENLQMIKATAPDAPLLGVTTHCDVSESESPDALRDRAVGRFAHMIRPIVSVDSKTGKNFDQLRSALVTAARSMPDVVQKVPSLWLELLEDVRLFKDEFF
jgi:hypothetical protein